MIDDPVAVSDPGSADAPGEYAFYEMLPNFEVEVPDRIHTAKRDQPAAPVVTPGAYVLQAGAYREACRRRIAA